MEFSEEDFLEFTKRLLGELHQAGLTGGSNNHVHAVYVAKGAQYVETQVNYTQPLPNPPQTEEPLPNPPQKGRGNELPEVLATEEAMVLWRKVQEAGWIDSHYQPLISRTQAALLADAMAERLGLKEKWKVFEGLWGRKYMYRDYYQAMNQKKSLKFQDELKMLFV